MVEFQLDQVPKINSNGSPLYNFVSLFLAHGFIVAGEGQLTFGD